MLGKETRVFSNEVLLGITKNLEITDIKRLMSASLEIKLTIENNPIIWKRYLSGSSTCMSSKYLAAVKKEHWITRGWTAGSIQLKKSINYPTFVEITKMKVYGDIMVISSNSSTVYVYDLQLNLVGTLAGHKGSVWAFDYRDNLLVTGSTDKTAKIWDCFLGICTKTLIGHKSTIRCVVFADDYVITGSRDKTVRVWHVKTGVCKYVLAGHKDSIRDLSVVKHKPLVISGSYDGTVILWNYKTGEGIRYLARTSRRVYCARYLNGSVNIAGMDQTLTVTTLDGKVMFRSKDHFGTIFKIKSDLQGSIYVFTANGILGKWDVKRKQNIFILQTCSKAVDFAILNHLLVVGMSTRIMLYKKTTGEYIRTIAIVEQLYSLCCTEDSLFYASKNGSCVEVHTVQFTGDN